MGPDVAQGAAAPSWPEGGYTLHRYGRISIGALPGGPAGDLRGPEPGGKDALTEAEALGLAALRLRESDAYRTAKEKRPRAGESWDMRGCLAAVGPLPDSGVLSADVQPHSTNSEYLEGSVAVGIVFVQGPTADLQFTEDEVIKAVAEVQGGLGFFTTANPVAGISFAYDIQNVALTVSPDSSLPPDADAETLEAVWRDPTLASLGHKADASGVRSYIEAIRKSFSTRWAYCVFFARYPLYSSAYATADRTHVVMDYDNGAYGPDNIDTVFAHETGHVFGCPDEYASAVPPCDCGGSHGRYGLVNGNCETCAGRGGADCLMKSNILTLCQYTPGHLGWSPRLLLRDYGYEKGGYRTERHVRTMARVTANRRPAIFGFAEDGVYLSPGQPGGRFGTPRRVVTELGYETGWRVEKHPRFLADVTSSSGDDIVGFGDQGVWTALAVGDGTFKEAKFVLAEFGYERGWRVEKHPRFLADITGDGTADIVGFGDQGVWTALSNGDGTFKEAKFMIAELGYETGWRVEKHPRFLADITGDGTADIVGFGDQGVWTALSNGDGTFKEAKFVLADLGYESGWRVERHPRLMATITLDPGADIVAFGDHGVWSAVSNGDGSFRKPKFVVNQFGYVAGGWRVDKHPRLLADTTGDRGLADIVGFGAEGVWMARSLDDGEFDTPGLVRPQFGYSAGGWRVDKHPRLLADTTGSGKADIVGFGNDGVFVARM
ncbi:VCBS repeat-containing protein [Streptomyces longisporoflavus]|uniref:VCBS repeat-containing protein n=1 Tax=Streptomyces longisporoflavus TaxID=28044 RepID=UPI00167E451C|nr:VCBS repeat-containing protein [Streptomyces longisporoflavus]